MIGKPLITGFFLLFTIFWQDPVKPLTARNVLHNTLVKLSAIQQFSYRYDRELSYSSENYFNKMGGQCYFDFTDNNPLTRFKFSFTDNNTYIFNGAEYFWLNNTDTTMQVTAKPRANQFESTSFFCNSLITLKNTLPLVLADSSINMSLADTLIDAKPHYKVSLRMVNRRFAYIKGFDELKFKVVKRYDICIDRQTGLPVQITEFNNLNTDFVKTTFTQINLAPVVPAEQYWFYSTYTPKYAIKAAHVTTIIKPGVMAPDWKLPLYGQSGKDSVALNRYRGKLTLIDFWIKNCGPCILSIPELNAMHKRYAGKINMVSINAYDRLEEVDFFVKKHKPAYLILYNGQPITKQYGISGYPAIVLINRYGKVLYAAEGFDKAKVEQLIRENL